MPIQFQKLTENELNTFIKMRINQLREEGATEDIDLTPSLLDYYRRHMADGTFISWIAVDNGKTSAQVECQLWRNRRISAVQREKSGFCQVCSQTRNTDVGALQGNCFQEL